MRVAVRYGSIVAVVCAVVVWSGCSSSGDAERPESPTTGATAAGARCENRGQTVRRDLRYRDVPPGVDSDLLSLDVYGFEARSDCPGAPVLVFVHGGGWRGGDKRTVIGDKAALARDQGWVFVSVNYRLSPAVTYPVHDDDVAAAVVWVHEHARDYGGDPSGIVLAGHSAGATITASVAIDERHLARAGGDLGLLRCAIPIDSAYDVVTEAGAGRAIYLQAFGPDPAGWEEASLFTHIASDAGIPPFLVVTRGPDAWNAKAQRLVDELVAAGVDARLLDAGTLTHAEVNRVIGSAADDVVTPALVDFVDSCTGHS